MFVISLSNHAFQIKNKYLFAKSLCYDYLIETPGIPIYVSDEEIAAEKSAEVNAPMGYLESLAIYRKICEHLLEDDILLFHCSALELDGKAYLFTAPSGTGKSTHARLWRERFGERLTMINDDKPLLAIREEGITVYGTPFAGKENLQTNTSAPVAGIVILHQAPENKIRRMTAREAYPMLLNQTYRRKDPEGMIRTMDLVQKLSELPVYALGCTISQEAVDLAYQALTGEDTDGS